MYFDGIWAPAGNSSPIPAPLGGSGLARTCGLPTHHFAGIFDGVHLLSFCTPLGGAIAAIGGVLVAMLLALSLAGGDEE